MIANINKLVEVPALKNFYSEQLDFSLLNSIKESDVKTPIVVSKNFQIIDGYRRVQVCKELGISSVPVIIVNDEASLNERITRNLTREKTPEDKIKEMQHIFKKYPKRQGKRKGNEKPYVRDEVISDALGGRWKGDVIINKLENILINDIENKVLSKGIVEKNWKIETCYEFLSKLREVDIKNNWGYSEKLISGELSINEVTKFIKERIELENNYKDTFVIPKKANSFNIDCIELGKNKNYHAKIDTIFTSIPYYSLRFYDNDVLIEETKEEYCQRFSEYFKALMPLLKNTANVMINIGETYKDGVGLGIPDILREYIVKTTGLIYKDRLVWSKGNNTKPQNETIKRTVNNVEYILWFVVDPKEAKYKMLTYTDGSKDISLITGAREINNKGKVGKIKVTIGKHYKKLYTHLQEQEILNVINCAAGKNHDVYKVCSEGHPAIMSAALPVIPILMTTDEGDIVCDPFAGTNVVGRITCLLNRIALTTERSKKYYDIGCKMLENSVNDFDRGSLDLINEIAYPKPPKLALLDIEIKNSLTSSQDIKIIEPNNDLYKYESIYFENGSQLFHCDNLKILRTLPENSISSIVTDPPYHLTQITTAAKNKRKASPKNQHEYYNNESTGLMGKTWDGGDIAFQEDFWKECLRVLKPGGYLLSFGHSRTYHKMATAIELAGFEIRDQIMWLYSQGLIKSQDMGKSVDKLQGNERELLGIKKNNKINMRFKYENDKGGWLKNQYYSITKGNSDWEGWGTSLKPAHDPIIVAKKPISESTITKNILRWNVGGINLQANKFYKSSYYNEYVDCEILEKKNNINNGRLPSNLIISDEINEGWKDYFYCAKASKIDKNEGLEYANIHPTVKPTELMQHLVSLVTPKDGICLDPFAGSGSTGKACIKKGIKFILIEKESEYFEIAKQRIHYEILKSSINPN